MDKNNKEIIWNDRKRVLGMPLSFTKYSIKNNRLYTSTGVLSTKEDEILLYRILDLKIERTLWDRIFRVGTITLFTRDESDRELKLVRIKSPKKIRDMLSTLVEESRGKVKIKGREMYGASGSYDDGNDNGEDLDNDTN